MSLRMRVRIVVGYVCTVRSDKDVRCALVFGQATVQAVCASLCPHKSAHFGLRMRVRVGVHECAGYAQETVHAWAYNPFRANKRAPTSVHLGVRMRGRISMRVHVRMRERIRLRMRGRMRIA